MKIKKWYVGMIEHGKRFASAWDYACISNDAYGAGYEAGKKAVVDAFEIANDEAYGMTWQDGLQHIIQRIKDPDHEEVDYDLSNGGHQLSTDTFKRWKKENQGLDFEDALRAYLIHWDIKEIRVVEDKNGVVSFQGMGERK